MSGLVNGWFAFKFIYSSHFYSINFCKITQFQSTQKLLFVNIQNTY
jgi:hypothetical protein